MKQTSYFQGICKYVTCDVGGTLGVLGVKLDIGVLKRVMLLIRWK